MILIFPNPKAFLIFYAGSVETLAEISEGLCRMQQELMGFCSAGPLTCLSHAPGTSLLPLLSCFCFCIQKWTWAAMPWSLTVQGEDCRKECSRV